MIPKVWRRYKGQRLTDGWGDTIDVQKSGFGFVTTHDVTKIYEDFLVELEYLETIKHSS